MINSKKTQGDLESSFHTNFDGKLKFEKFSLVKNLFKKNCRKRVKKVVFCRI